MLTDTDLENLIFKEALKAVERTVQEQTQERDKAINEVLNSIIKDLHRVKCLLTKDESPPAAASSNFSRNGGYPNPPLAPRQPKTFRKPKTIKLPPPMDATKELKSVPKAVPGLKVSTRSGVAVRQACICNILKDLGTPLNHREIAEWLHDVYDFPGPVAKDYYDKFIEGERRIYDSIRNDLRAMRGQGLVKQEPDGRWRWV
jgi:hypothetical protein